jgi:hypothetical protein
MSVVPGGAVEEVGVVVVVDVVKGADEGVVSTVLVNPVVDGRPAGVGTVLSGTGLELSAMLGYSVCGVTVRVCSVVGRMDV